MPDQKSDANHHRLGSRSHGFPENVVCLVLDDLLSILVGGAALSGWDQAAFERHPLDVRHAGYGASAHGRGWP